MPPSPKKRLLSQVLKRLRQSYGPAEWKCWGKAVDVLVETILSQNTNHANSSAGYRNLRRRFRSWNRAADAPVAEVEKCIRISGLSRVKAPRIQNILRQVRGQYGRIDLQSLGRLQPREAYEELMRFEGVGPKTASCVLMFSFGMPIFPVDTHIDRIAKRLRLSPRGLSPEKIQRLLTPLIAPADRYAMHVLLIAHGRKTCLARGPRCEWCDLSDLCPAGGEQVRESRRRGSRPQKTRTTMRKLAVRRGKVSFDDQEATSTTDLRR